MESYLPSDQYLWQCKVLHLANIFPSASDQDSQLPLVQLRSIAKTVIEQKGLSHFSGFLQEVQYSVDLHTAHIILESDIADRDLKEECIDMIRRYCTTPLNPVLAEQERQWLKTFERT